jgi:2-C-methyl-D-erythritol 4-phosphate cytidylyltransferase
VPERSAVTVSVASERSAVPVGVASERSTVHVGVVPERSAVTVGVVLVAAGAGTRLGSPGPKALVEVAGRSLLAHALAGLAAAGLPAPVVVHAPDHREAFEASAGAVPVAAWVPGGATRTDSVRAGVAALPDTVEVVAVHDAARPLTPPDVMRATVAAVRGDVLAAAPGIAVADTLKRIAGVSGGDRGAAAVSNSGGDRGAAAVSNSGGDRGAAAVGTSGGDGDSALLGEVVGTVDRSHLVGVQTPQAFPRAVLSRALAAADDATDDLALVEQLVERGELTGRVVVVPGSVWGWKVTRPNDLALVAALATTDRQEEAGG